MINTINRTKVHSKGPISSINNSRAALSSLIPIACHYNQHTLLTKNGELLQTIKISGLVNVKNIASQNNMRNAIRSILENNLIDPNISIYMHVMRNKIGVPSLGRFESNFGLSVEQQWRIVNNYDEELINTLYITVIHRGRNNTNFIANVISSTLFNAFTYHHFRILDKSYGVLNSFVEEFLSAIEIYDAQVLGVKRAVATSGYESELLSFFYKIVHLCDKPILLEECDASEQLADLHVAYKQDSLTISNDGEKTRYAFILTIKYPYNVESALSDRILQFPHEMMLTETVVLASTKESVVDFRQHIKVYSASHSDHITMALNLDKILNTSPGKEQRFCQQQITITLHSTDEITLQYEMEKFYQMIKETGISVIKEDVNLATVFFSQVPGNFKYLSRLSYNAVKYSCNFASIHNSKRGMYHGSKWGPPITILRSVDGTPFFFNFHYKDSGNTLIYGTNLAETKTVLRFMLSQATRLNVKHILINTSRDRSELIQSFGDMCEKIIVDSVQASPIQIDILDVMGNFYGNKVLFATTLAVDLLHSTDPQNDSQKIMQVLDHVISEEDAIKRNTLLESFKIQHIESTDSAVQKLLAFFNSDVYKNLFAKQQLPNVLEKNITNIYVRSGLQNTPEIQLLIGICAIKMQDQLNGEPTLISFNDANFLFKFEYTAVHLENWLHMLEKKNAAAILNVSEKKLLRTDIFQICSNIMATKIILSDRLLDKKNQRALMIDDQEYTRLKCHDRNNRAFLIKQGNISVFSIFNIEEQAPELNKMIGEVEA